MRTNSIGHYEKGRWVQSDFEKFLDDVVNKEVPRVINLNYLPEGIAVNETNIGNPEYSSNPDFTKSYDIPFDPLKEIQRAFDELNKIKENIIGPELLITKISIDGKDRIQLIDLSKLKRKFNLWG